MLGFVCRSNSRGTGHVFFFTSMATSAMPSSTFDISNVGDVQQAVRRFYDEPDAEGNRLWKEWLQAPPSIGMRNKLASLRRCTTEQRAKSCGIGWPYPEAISGAKILDIGCGVGVDCITLSELVGDEGKVVGLDICPTLIDEARTYASDHGIANVEYICDDAEDMASSERVLANAPYDIIVANCSFCQIRNCARCDVAQSVYSLLKPGGEFYMCDLFVSVDVSDCARASRQAWAQGYAGAWMWHQFVRTMEDAKFSSPIILSSRKLQMSDERCLELAAYMGVQGVTAKQLKELQDVSGFQMVAATYRLFRPLDVSAPASELADSAMNAARMTFNAGAHAEPHIQLSRKFLCRASQSVVVPKDFATVMLRSRLAVYFTVVPVASVVRLQPENQEPFFPKPVKPGKLASSPLSMPVSGLTLLNGTVGNGGSSLQMTNLAEILDSDPTLKGLRDLVEKSRSGGCGPGGC